MIAAGQRPDHCPVNRARGGCGLLLDEDGSRRRHATTSAAARPRCPSCMLATQLRLATRLVALLRASHGPRRARGHEWQRSRLPIEHIARHLLARNLGVGTRKTRSSSLPPASAPLVVGKHHRVKPPTAFRSPGSIAKPSRRLVSQRTYHHQLVPS